MFGKRLNETRKNKGFTAQQMADSIGVGLRTYRNYESERSYPDFEKLIGIADKLDVSFLPCQVLVASGRVFLLCLCFAPSSDIIQVQAPTRAEYEKRKEVLT